MANRGGGYNLVRYSLRWMRSVLRGTSTAAFGQTWTIRVPAPWAVSTGTPDTITVESLGGGLWRVRMTGYGLASLTISGAPGKSVTFGFEVAL